MKNLRMKEIIIALLLTSFLIACGGGNDNNNTPPTPAVSIAITPASATAFTDKDSAPFSVAISGSTNTGYTVTASPATGAGCPAGAQSGSTFRCKPTAAGTYTITATASADSTKTSSPVTLIVTDPVAPSSTANCAGVFGTGSKKATIAVASNFRLPAYELITAYFQASSYGDDTEVTVCGDSTATLITEINGGNPRDYVMLFVADESARQEFGSEAFTYARGVPVLAAMKAVIPDASGLITSIPALSGDVVTITEGGAELGDKYQINIAAAAISVADPEAAPYGKAAELILKDMMDIDVNVGDKAELPSWIFSDGNASNGLWNNIDRTWWAFNGNPGGDSIVAGKDTSGVKSGFIAKSQICGDIAPKEASSPYVYVEFMYPEYIRNQTAVVIDSGDPVASSLDEYIKEAMANGEWATFLDNNCYLPVD